MSDSEYLEAVDRYCEITLPGFEEQALRLRDPSCLDECTRILSLHFKTLHQLGTIEHEVAVAALKNQLAILHPYVKASGTRAGEILKAVFGRRDPSAAQDAAAIQATLTRLHHLKDSANPETLEDYERSIEVVEDVGRALRNSHRIDRLIDVHLLFLQGKMHVQLYTRLYLQRVLSFVGTHIFVLLWSVLLFGAGYSWLSGEARSLIERLPHVTGWCVPFLFLLPFFIKEYVLSRPLRSARLKVETWLLRPVVHRVFFAHTRGLLDEMRKRNLSDPVGHSHVK